MAREGPEVLVARAEADCEHERDGTHRLTLTTAFAYVGHERSVVLAW
jgi:hypothetical protein